MNDKKAKELVLKSGLVTLDTLLDRLMRLRHDPTSGTIKEIATYKQEFENKLEELLGSNWREER